MNTVPSFRLVSCLKLALLIAFFSVFSSCQSTIPVTIMHPGEVNLKGVKVIGIGSSTGQNSAHSQDLATRLSSALLASNYFEKVIDRRNLDALAKEHNLSLKGMTNDAYATGIGKYIGAANLIFLQITNDTYNEDVKSQSVQRYNSKTKSSYTTTAYTRTGKYNFTFSMKVTNTETSEILGEKAFPIELIAETSSEGSSPDPIDRNQLYDNCLAVGVDKSIAYLIPHPITVNLEYLEDGDLPKRDTIQNYLTAGETDTALEMLSNAAKKSYSKPQIKAMALYNYGIILVYMGQINDGIDLLKQAIKLDDQKKQYFDSLQMAKQEKANYEKLQTQLKTPSK